jgi:hypothetical protein
MSVSRGGQFIGFSLLNASAVTNLTTNIYEGLRPMGTDFPAINFYEMPGGSRLNSLHVEMYSVTCRATTIGSVKSLAEAVVTLFGGSSGTGTMGVSDGFGVSRISVVRQNGIMPEPESNCYASAVDVSLVF